MCKYFGPHVEAFPDFCQFNVYQLYLAYLHRFFFFFFLEELYFRYHRSIKLVSFFSLLISDNPAKRIKSAKCTLYGSCSFNKNDEYEIRNSEIISFTARYTSSAHEVFPSPSRGRHPPCKPQSGGSPRRYVRWHRYRIPSEEWQPRRLHG